MQNARSVAVLKEFLHKDPIQKGQSFPQGYSLISKNTCSDVFCLGGSVNGYYVVSVSKNDLFIFATMHCAGAWCSTKAFNGGNSAPLRKKFHLFLF